MPVSPVQSAVGAQTFAASVTATLAAAPTDGNLLVLIGRDVSSSPTLPSGFTTQAISTGGQVAIVATKIAASDGTSYTISRTGSTVMESQILEFSGVDTTTPMDAAAVFINHDFSAPWPEMWSPSITTATAGAAHLIVAVNSTTVETARAGSEIDPTYSTPVVGAATVSAIKTIATASTVAAVRIGYSSNGDGARFSLAIRASGGAPAAIPARGRQLPQRRAQPAVTVVARQRRTAASLALGTAAIATPLVVVAGNAQLRIRAQAAARRPAARPLQIRRFVDFLFGASSDITIPSIASTSTLATDLTLSAGAITVTIASIASTSTLYAIALAGNITVPSIASSSTLATTLALTPGSITVTLPGLSDGDTLTAPTLSANMILPGLSDGDTLTAPTLSASMVLPGYTDADTATAPTLSASMVLPGLSDADTLSPPTLSTGVTVTLPGLSDGDTLTAPTLTPGSITITLPGLSDGDTLSPPTLSANMVLPGLSDPDTLTPPALTAGAITAILPGLTGAAILFPPILTASSITVTLTGLTDPDSFGAITLTISGSTQPGCLTVTVQAATAQVAAAAASVLLGVTAPQVQVVAGVPQVAVDVDVPSVSITSRCC